MTKKLIIPAVLACMLAACEKPTTSSNVTIDISESEVANDSAAGTAAGQTTNDSMATTDNATNVPMPTPTSTAKTANAFPAAYQGRWGMNANDCDPKRDDNKGLLTVSAETLKFYESRARIASLKAISPTRLIADLSFSGEGQTWNSKTAFELTDGGKTLLRTEEEPASSYRYAKCPAV
ncbi:hypothetical protein G4G27_02745 [Sphingomonas sp. So64.6b]|uniref:hypothetical protein n=1 Tax=Sphingomonas sp. So64.6b TaxID=2997354 RepID=UPI00160163C9|nr:hypothetical protein [Sphingomonas sp. So64.6b]QNA83052.1 hypothetical protein G4G27_02745 [Sphingomonas sp. So64.6b]